MGSVLLCFRAVVLHSKTDRARDTIVIICDMADDGGDSEHGMGGCVANWDTFEGVELLLDHCRERWGE